MEFRLLFASSAVQKCTILRSEIRGEFPVRLLQSIVHYSIHHLAFPLNEGRQLFYAMQTLLLQVFVCFLLASIASGRYFKEVPRLSRLCGKQHCILISKEYHSSKLEQTWVDNAHRWSDDFCSHMDAFTKETHEWLATISALNHNKSSSAIDENIFSSFVSSYDCNGKIVQKRTWIEPLSHGLRHPRALCDGGADLVDRDYLLLDSHDEFRSPATKRHELCGGCVGRSCQNIYVDLGASTWNTGGGGPSQSWFYDSYKRHGIEFDRLLLWEANPTPAAAIFSDLPKDVWHKYQYFNWPASSNSSDASSPLHIIKKIAKPGDFVVLKLDIDTPSVELPILRDLLNDPELLDLVDEFFFEYHVLFGPMNPAWFGSENPNPRPTTETLADSYAVFRTLREKGVRAHSWV